jgi:TonB-linked outer membrane protein, SusC/RagA family/TonB-dependent outer membrane receptor, SusC/RagA subfamily, signature region
MVKNPSRSILFKKCLRKIMLIFGISSFLLIQGTVSLLAGSGLNVSFSDYLQQIKVSGRVVDANNHPLIGVNVVEKGTTNGVMTGADGTYALTVASGNSTITFSFIGFDPKEVIVGNQTTVDITLSESINALEEVVVVGYGTQRREAVTGSVASIGGDKIRDVPSSNITQALQGRISGVDMEQTSTKPGAVMQVRIRGTRSLNASNDPLVVLDGIPFAGSIGDISTSDIKSIDILKDAAATAIYGSRGANGVILITSNKGLKGQKAQVTLNSYFGLKKIFAQYPMMNGPEFRALRTAANMYPIDGADESDAYNTNWQDLLYRTAAVTSHDLGISGGTEKGNYNFGVGYLKDEAVIPGQDYSRFSFRGTLDQEIGKFFRFGFTTNNSYSITMNNNVMYGVLSMSPLANPYNTDGTWKRTIKMPLDEQWTYSKDIINNLGDSFIDQTKAYSSYNTVYAEVKIPGIEGLKYRANVGANFRMSNGGQYTGQGVFALNATTVSTATVSNSLATNWAIENLLTYDRTFAQKHQVNFVALYSAEQTLSNNSSVSAKDIPADALQFYNLGRAAGEFTINPDYQGYQLSGLMSWMGRVMYSYDDRYMLSVTYRSDASSRLAEGHKWHSYPAVSIGWNIANESFMKNISQINSLKLRVGYGETSNQSVNPYATLGLLSTRPYNFGTLNATGFYVSQLPNPNLGWEFSKTWNYGLDFAILKNRLSGTVEYYVTNTSDILLNLNLPPTSGVSGYTGNIGATQNKGWEVSLNGVILDNPDGFTWEAGINLYGNRNKLVALASGQPDDKTNWWFVGHPIDVIYDYENIGIWQAGDPYLNILEGPAGKPGMIKVKYTGDFNPDGTPTRLINSSDQQIISLEPKFQGGFNTSVAYKGFDLGVIGAFKSGGVLISTLYSSAGYLNLLTGRRGNVKVDYWTPDNTGAKYPAPGNSGVYSGDNPKYGSTLGYFDGSYLKIRTITLGYSLSQKLINKIGIDKFRIYVTVQNPFVMFSPYNKETGLDPETNSYGNENAAVPLSYNLRRLLTIGTNTPSTRNYLIGLNLTF